MATAKLIDSRQHCTYAPERWASAADLSARVWIAWRDAYLYLVLPVRLKAGE